MNKVLVIGGICCALPLIIVGGIFLSRGQESLSPADDAAADLQSPSIETGGLFPDFNVTEVDGRVITRDSLQGKPAIIWFTTSWCIPCQIGAREVAKLDDELGGGAFDIVVIFVDPRENDSDLIGWREQFARGDWMVAFDNPADSVAEKLKVKFLDTKYLLDREGVIENLDIRQVNEAYLGLLRQTVEQG